MEIEVTAALLRAMNGCAATELGQVVWVKLESATRGSLVDIDAQEARFIGYPDLSVFLALPAQTVQGSQNRTLLLRHRRPTRYDETGF